MGGKEDRLIRKGTEFPQSLNRPCPYQFFGQSAIPFDAPASTGAPVTFHATGVVVVVVVSSFFRRSSYGVFSFIDLSDSLVSLSPVFSRVARVGSTLSRSV